MTSRVLFRSKVRFPSRVRFHFAVGILPLILLFIGLCGCPDRSYQAPLPDYSTTVSYTHLTLPTILLV